MFASLSGAFVISATSLPWLESNYLLNVIIITMSGFVGNIADSVFGSSLQAQYKCSRCGAVTERKIHCNEKTDLAKGKRWVNNDAVNFGAGITGGIFSIILYDVVRA